MEVVAGDGTKIKASASKAANATAAGLDEQIAGLEAVIEAGVAAWMEQARAEDAAEDALSGDRPPGGGPGNGGSPGTLARTAEKLVRRRKARAKLAAEAAARQEQAGAQRAEKISKLEDRAAARRGDADREEAAAGARVAGYQRRAAAKAAAGGRKRPDGRVPVPPAQHISVRKARRAADRAAAALAAAAAAPAVPAGPAREPRANTTDPASRVMPAKKGGYDQLCNVQAVAGAHQVILSVGTHDNPSDTQALHPALAAARASLDAAGIHDPIGAALFDAGYASEDNFTTPCGGTSLYVAVTRESRQTGRRRDGSIRAAAQPGWQAMTARLATPEGKALCKRRSAMIEPVFAQLFARLGRHLNYRDTKTDLELHLWAATHNMLKAIRAAARQRAATATEAALAS